MRGTNSLAEDAAALDAFERRREQLGGDWLQRMRFGASHRALYVDAIDRRLAADRPAEAFAIQERYRAYERRRLLAGRVPLPALDAAAPRVDELVAALGPAEAVLSWVVGAIEPRPSCSTADGLAVRTLPLGEAELAARDRCAGRACSAWPGPIRRSAMRWPSAFAGAASRADRAVGRSAHGHRAAGAGARPGPAPTAVCGTAGRDR
jgi:hypothetical protein